ncbi:MAG: ABC transporter substrate-binding protein [Methylobacteriaceae bacterium]|jgi:peptide/nickel transport system substrate-binding protein|nr:ABC transporter substrate-binding protein [Methylobacteriaceae bacterium]
MTDRDLIQHLTRRGRISRRGFITGALAAGFSLATAERLWAQSEVAKPASGGHIKLGITVGQASDTLDPANWGESFMILTGFAIRGGILEYGADGTLKPDLVESWEHTDDVTKWIFKVRKGATFSNGKTVTAEDVVASLNHHRGPDSKSGAKSVFQSVKDIKADGADSFIIELDAPAIEFPYLLTDYHLTVAPLKDGKPDYLGGIGAGPFILENFEPGVRASFKRNPNAYKAVNFDSAEIISIVDDVARQSALVTGAVDVINRPDLKTVDLLAKARGLQVGEVAGRRHYWLVMNNTTDPFTNNDIRTALKYGIDREEILKLVYLNHGAVANDQPITPAYKFHDPAIAAKPLDPDKAKFHLKKAGVDTLEVEFIVATSAFDGALDMVTLYQKHAEKAGIKINIRKEAPDGYWDSIDRLRKANGNSLYATWWAGRPTEDGMLTGGYTGPWNYSHWENEKFVSLLTAARSEVDETKRRQMYGEMQQLVSDESGVVIPVWANTIHAQSDKIGHPEKLGTGSELDDHRLLERWWRKS